MTQKLRASFSTERDEEEVKLHGEGKRMAQRPRIAPKRNRATACSGLGSRCLGWGKAGRA